MWCGGAACHVALGEHLGDDLVALGATHEVATEAAVVEDLAHLVRVRVGVRVRARVRVGVGVRVRARARVRVRVGVGVRVRVRDRVRVRVRGL